MLNLGCMKNWNVCDREQKNSHSLCRRHTSSREFISRLAKYQTFPHNGSRATSCSKQNVSSDVRVPRHNELLIQSGLSTGKQGKYAIERYDWLTSDRKLFDVCAGAVAPNYDIVSSHGKERRCCTSGQARDCLLFRFKLVMLWFLHSVASSKHPAKCLCYYVKQNCLDRNEVSMAVL